MSREVLCYDYVPVPYDRVRDALRRDAGGIFQRATRAAAARAGYIVATLRHELGAVEVGVDVHIEIAGGEEVVTRGEPTTTLRLHWMATRNAGLFPPMTATLAVYPLSPRETQLDLQGSYTPPLGVVGEAADALVGHRIAQATVLRFLQDVSARLRDELA